MFTFIEIDRIEPHPDNPRKDLGDLTELAESIKLNGVLQNLTVIPWNVAHPDEPIRQDYYTVVIGHRRLAAAKLAGNAAVPCIITNISPREQIATMLLENMQRNDLTVYEQAQGFQMMLNFGDSINDIAEKTGFSETTVRRRVKLLELDQDKFEKSVARGGTLQDYAELNKIEDITLRNGVLDKIGTSNFTWELQKAIDKEKREKVAAAIIAELEKFATRIEDRAGLLTVKHYYTSQGSEVTIPDDVNTVNYFFVPSDYGYVSLYKESLESQTNSVPVMNEKIQEAQDRRAALEEISKRAYQLRRAFVFELSNTLAKIQIGIIAECLIGTLLDGYNNLNEVEYAEFFGIDGDDVNDGEENEDGDDVNDGEENEDGEVDDELQPIISEHVTAEPYRHLLASVWLLIDGENKHYFDWHNQHHDNKDLNKVYRLLNKLGYEMSDEERQLQDGTHELFERSDTN